MGKAGIVMTVGKNTKKLFKISGLVLVGGLVVEAITLLWFHPMAFLINIGIGSLLIGVGVIVYLYLVVLRPN